MRLQDSGSDGLTVWISANETWEWARRWPCSQLSGKAVVASFDSGGLVDLAVNGRSDVDVDANEFSACVADHVARRIKSGHPLWDVVVGPYLEEDACSA